MFEHIPPPGDERCRVALIGDSTIAMHCLRSLRSAGHEVVACFANGEAFAASVRREGISTFDSNTPLTALTDIPCDWLVSANNARLIPAEILRHPTHGTINFHDGPLPRYAGLYAPTRALLEGEDEHAVTWHMVEEGIDTGDIIIQTPVPIYSDDTSQTLNLRCLETGAQAFDELAPKLGQWPLLQRRQDLTQRTYFGNAHWPREGMEINWQWPASKIQRGVRALDFGPFPNPIGLARFRVNHQWHRLLKAELCPNSDCPNQKARPGTLTFAEDEGLHIATSDGCLVATRVAPTITLDTCRLVKHAEIKPPGALAQIAAWEERIFKFDRGWRFRLEQRLDDSKSTAPQEMQETMTVDLGETDYDLICGILAWGLTLGRTQLEVGRWWTEQEVNEWVASAGDSAVASLLHPVAPIVIEIDPNISILSFANKWLELVAESQQRGPFFADLLERGGSSQPQMTNPATLPVQWFSDNGGAARVELSSWRIHRENGRWLASGTPSLSHAGDLACALRKVIKEQPSTTIAKLPLLGLASAALVFEWENGGSFKTAPTSFLVLIFNEFTRSESATAIETADGELWTYGQLGRKVASLMAKLRKAGVEPGDSVPIRLGRSPELVAAQLAVMGVGCTFVTISEESPALQVQDILHRVSARVAIGLPLQNGDTTVWLSALMNHGQPESELASDCMVPFDNQIACVFFTSGSTGKSKGVKITHRGLDAYTEDSMRYFGHETFQRSIWTSSVAFDSTLSEVMIPLAVGGSVVIPKPESIWSIRGFVESLAAYQVTFIGISTALWSAWMRDAIHVSNPIPPKLRLVGVGGGVLSPKLVEQWLSLADDSTLLCNGYGPTETTVVCTHYDIDRESLSFPSIPIGYPNRGAKIRVLDEQQRRVAPGVIGELVIGGLGVADGYLDNPEQTAERFIELTNDKGKWHRTGDLGSWTNNGELLFHGRIDEQVKISGYRVEPEGISRAIRSLGGVKDAEVIAFGDEVSKELGAAVIRAPVCDADADADADNEYDPNSDLSDLDWIAWLQDRLEDQLPRYSIPRRWLVVDKWPRTTSEKVDRKKLTKRFTLNAQQSMSVELLDPRDRQSVLQAIRIALGRPNAALSESFFNLGGDSMAAVALQVELESAVGKALPLSLIYGSNTLADIIDGVAYHAGNNEPVVRDCWQTVSTIPGAVDLVFMPGIHGPATLRHLWPEVGTFASVHAIELGVEDYREVESEVLDAGAIRHFADNFAALVLKHLPNRSPVLVGYSLGGWFAFETAHALQRRGAPAPQLLLMEPGAAVVGGPMFRQQRQLELWVNRLTDAVFFWRPLNTERSQRTEAENEIKMTVDRFLSNYHPQPTSAPIHTLIRKWRLWHIVVKKSRPWRFASLRRLANGPFKEEIVPLEKHTDFVKPVSTELLTALLRRVAARQVDTGDDRD